MKTSFFLSISLGCISAVAAVVFATPAMAQGEQNAGATGYCTGETVQISGWETDLVRRNKGLEKFHWSAINTVQHYQTSSPIVANHAPAKALTPYHYSKPTVVSNWSNTRGPIVEKTASAGGENGRRSGVGAHLRNCNGSNVYAQVAHIPQVSSYGYQQAQYGGERSVDPRVSARMLHY